MLSNQKCQIQPTLINLHPNEYSQEFYCYPLVVKLDWCVRSCNTLIDLSYKVYVPKKEQKIYERSVFNKSVIKMKRINESKTSTKLISCKCKCKFYETKI